MHNGRMLQLAARWWPAPVAVIMFLTHILTWWHVAPIGIIGLLTMCTGLALVCAHPRLAAVITVFGVFLAPFAEHTDAALLFLTVGLGAALLLTWRIDSWKQRLIFGAAIAALAPMALSIVSARAHFNGSHELATWHALDLWLVVVACCMAVISARTLRDFVRSHAEKNQAVARTTVVESELRDERLRADLTHDFHDVMAHSLAVLAAQAEGLRLSHNAHPERIEPVLTTISDTARLALVEVRQLLERVDDDARRPQPTSANIPALVAQVRSAGPTVRLHDVGTHGHLSQVADIAAYRIVQESLTNALRHGGSDVEIVVSLTWTGPGLTLAISSPIRSRDALKPAGRGIAGMQERARLAGGTLEITADGDDFVVAGHLPYSPISTAPTPPVTEAQLPTVPVQTQQRPEHVVAHWIAEASRRPQERAEADASTFVTRELPGNWSETNTGDLSAMRMPDGRVPNPTARQSTTPSVGE